MNAYIKELAEGIDVPCQFEAPRQPPEWLDKDKYEKGKDFFKKNPLSVLLSNFRNLVIGLSVTKLWLVNYILSLFYFSMHFRHFQWYFGAHSEDRNEEKGLLQPIRAGQNRVYSAADRARLILILRGKTLGLSLDQSADLISMYDPGSNNKRQLEALIEKIQNRRGQLQLQKQELERMIIDLDEWALRSRAAMQSK